MTDKDAPGPVPRELRFLKRLVTVLTVVMIAGLVIIIALLVTRLTLIPPKSALPALPEAISLPEGSSAHAFTQGTGWFAVVTDGDEILIFDSTDGALRQRIRID
ncbi:DUF6476 family protein [Plastorhodobacter daqingensis]|uniref:DUF6476 family protein n=1 Tax=Plastorhodobacter daqingensis TaxID=1387281 RepID=A0ABW2UJB6_9RHOB